MSNERMQPGIRAEEARTPLSTARPTALHGTTRHDTAHHSANSSVDQSIGFRNAREEPDRPTNPDDSFDPLDDGRWLVAIRHDRIAGTVTLLDFNPVIVDVLRSKRWATLVRGVGWTIPTRYLAHTEKLLCAASVDLFDVDGAPTPGQRDRERSDERADTKRVLADLRAARDAAHIDELAVDRARREARAAFDRAIADRHPEHADSGAAS